MDMSGARGGAGGGRRDRRAGAAGRPRSPSSRRPRTCPPARAIKPGDVITQYNGKTVEVNNTDAEGRLILADALAYAVELGAERIVDIATLTGAVGSRSARPTPAVIANDDELAAEVDPRPARRPASCSGGCRSTPSTRS